MLSVTRMEELLYLNNSDECTRNGPYGDPESPIREMCHKAVILRSLFDAGQVSESVLYERVLELYNSSWKRSGNYFMRHPSGRRDSVNGIMGPAWAIEACVALSVSERVQRVSDQIIEGILKANPYNDKLKCWERSAPCGTWLGIDTTLNHQLWYASVVLMTPDRDLAIDFLEYQIPRIRLTRVGAILHDSPIAPLTAVSQSPSHFLRSWLYFLRGIRSGSEKSIAYHAFNLIALARCKRQVSDLTCWESRVIKALKEYHPPISAINHKLYSKYGDSYNPQLPGYVAFEKQFDCKFPWLHQLENENANYDYLRKIRDYEWLIV